MLSKFHIHRSVTMTSENIVKQRGVEWVVLKHTILPIDPPSYPGYAIKICSYEYAGPLLSYRGPYIDNWGPYILVIWGTLVDYIGAPTLSIKRGTLFIKYPI